MPIQVKFTDVEGYLSWIESLAITLVFTTSSKNNKQ
jgi:hypothetical protein